MAKLSKKEFAERCGIGYNALCVYVGRKKLNVLESGEIDDQDEKNHAFYIKYSRKASSKGVTPEKPPSDLPKSPFAPSQVRKTAAPVADNSSLANLETQKLELQIKKLSNENLKIEMSHQKIAGQFVKVDQTLRLFTIYSEACNTAWEIVLEEFINAFGAKYQLDREEIVRLRSEKNKSINLAKERALRIAKTALKNLYEKVADEKGIGEHS